MHGGLVARQNAPRPSRPLLRLQPAGKPIGDIQPHLAKGRLSRVLEDWCPAYPGYHLYYPSRRQSSAAFSLLVEALRHRG
jgi:DNA-binding transcriptional LysR family regulator